MKYIPLSAGGPGPLDCPYNARQPRLARQLRLLSKVVCPNRVVDRLTTPALGTLSYPLLEVFLSINDGVVGSGFPGQRCLSFSRDGGEDIGPRPLRHLDQLESGASGPRMDQGEVARLYPALKDR